VKAAGKVYSNTTLGLPDLSVAEGVTAPAECYMSISKGRCVTGEEMLDIIASQGASAEMKKQEPNYRMEAQTLRERIEKTQGEIASLSATAADESRPATERAIATKLGASRQSDLQTYEKKWLELEKRVKDYAIPHAFIEPVPRLSSRPQQH
jgi:hypothetical protein